MKSAGEVNFRRQVELAGDNELPRRARPAKKKIGSRARFSVLNVARPLDGAGM